MSEKKSMYNSKQLKSFEEIKKNLINSDCKKFSISNAILILDKISYKNIIRSLKNIPNIKVTDVNHFSAFDLIKFDKVIFSESSVKELEKRYL